MFLPSSFVLFLKACSFRRANSWLGFCSGWCNRELKPALDCLGRRVCHEGVGNRCFGLLQAVFDFLFFSVPSCGGSTERSPQDTDPDVPSSISAVTTETGSDEVFIISAGPGASGLSFTTYRIQVSMHLAISASHGMSVLDTTCHVWLLMLLLCKKGSD